MATKSTLKSIVIEDDETAKRLVDALEQAGNMTEREEQSMVSYSYANASDLKEMFG